jgi:hypothetical protein
MSRRRGRPEPGIDLGRAACETWRMSKIEDAARRLERAVARLEAACDRIAGQSTEKTTENKRLAAALAAKEKDYAALAAVADSVSARVDKALERLDAALEE